MTEPLSMPGFEGLEDAELVQRLPLFKTLSFEETRRLFRVARQDRAPTGKVLIEEHALGNALYLVRSGTLKVFAEGVLVNTVGAGEVVGEMSLVDDLLTSARVEVAEDADLLIISRTDFEKLMAEDLALQCKVYKAFCRTLSERLRRANHTSR